MKILVLDNYDSFVFNLRNDKIAKLGALRKALELAEEI
jgi:anthranilate/para-aminobenzoate synthase component II